MGILPLQFEAGTTRKTLNLKGDELISIVSLNNEMHSRMPINAIIQRSNGETTEIQLLSRIDTQNEIEYYKHGGILQYVLRKISRM